MSSKGRVKEGGAAGRKEPPQESQPSTSLESGGAGVMGATAWKFRRAVPGRRSQAQWGTGQMMCRAQEASTGKKTLLWGRSRAPRR